MEVGVPGVVSYTAGIVAYADGNQWKGAWSLHKEMVESGVMPNIVSYNALLYALWKTNPTKSSSLTEGVGGGVSEWTWYNRTVLV